MKEAEFYKKISDSAVQCQLCNHYCTPKNNETGKCNVRYHKNGKLYSLVYGYPVSVNIDPIEKKPFFHFLPGSHTLSLGTFGCNFKCSNCHNWEMSQADKITNKIEQLDYYSPEKIVEEALNQECKSISYTYNEPTIWSEYALDIMKLARENGLYNIWVSNGFMSAEALEIVLPLIDAINIDLKGFDESFYKNQCDGKFRPIIDNLKTIIRSPAHLEITTLIIPGQTDKIDVLKDIAEFISSDLSDSIPWHISKFSPEISWKLKNLSSTGEDVIYTAYEIGKEAGLKYVYTGNIPGDQKENTYCPNCGEMVIRRFGYEIDRLDEDGRCPSCDKDLDITE